MILEITNKVFSFGGGSKVQTPDGKDQFKVKGAVFSLAKKKQIYDLNKNLLFTVKNRLFNFNFKITTKIYEGKKNLIAKVERKFKIKNEFEVFGSDKKFLITSNNLGKHLDLYLGENKIGVVDRKFAVLDKYQLEVFDDKDAPFLVALVIAIDNIMDALRKRENKSNK